MSRRWVAPLIAIGVIAAIVVALMLVRMPSGLPSRSVASVPALLSEPAGIPGEGLTLLPNGLGAVDFGTDAETAIATLTELLGEPVRDDLQPCDSETDLVRWIRWGDLTAAFPDDRFAGWIIGVYYPADSPALRVTTEEGLALDAPVAELIATYGDRVAFHSTEEIGPGQQVEGFGLDGFSVDDPSPVGLGGFIEGGRDQGRVITFLAGQPCG